MGFRGQAQRLGGEVAASIPTHSGIKQELPCFLGLRKHHPWFLSLSI